MNHPLTPPIRFGPVAFPAVNVPADSESGSDDFRRVAMYSECMYRGAYPKHRNLRFLETLHLRTIISLTPKPIDQDESLREWAESQNGGSGIRLVHVRTEKPKEESGGLSREGAARAIMTLLDRENLPLYVHCLDGVEVTSTLVACLRKVQTWAEPCIMEELARGVQVSMGRLTGTPSEVPKHLEQFVQRFGQLEPVQLPRCTSLPGWVWPTPTRSMISAEVSRRSSTTANPTVQLRSIKLAFERDLGAVHAYDLAYTNLSGIVWSAVPRSRTPSSDAMSAVSERSSSREADVSADLDHDAQDAWSTSSHASASSRHGAPGSQPMSRDASSQAGLSYETLEDSDLRTPRARPTHVEGDVPPLMPAAVSPMVRYAKMAGGVSPNLRAQYEEQKTPLLSTSDSRTTTEVDSTPLALNTTTVSQSDHEEPAAAYIPPADDSPWLSDSHSSSHRSPDDAQPDTEAEGAEEEVDEMDDYDEVEEDSLALEALDLDGY